MGNPGWHSVPLAHDPIGTGRPDGETGSTAQAPAAETAATAAATLGATSGSNTDGMT